MDRILYFRGIKFPKKMIQDLKSLTLMNDKYARFFLNDVPTVEKILNIIFDKEDIKLTELNFQRQIINSRGKSIYLDIHAKDTKGEDYNLEIQNKSINLQW